MWTYNFLTVKLAKNVGHHIVSVMREKKYLVKDVAHRNHLLGVPKSQNENYRQLPSMAIHLESIG